MNTFGEIRGWGVRDALGEEVDAEEGRLVRRRPEHVQELHGVGTWDLGIGDRVSSRSAVGYRISSRVLAIDPTANKVNTVLAVGV